MSNSRARLLFLILKGEKIINEKLVQIENILHYLENITENKESVSVSSSNINFNMGINYGEQTIGATSNKEELDILLNRIQSLIHEKNIESNCNKAFQELKKELIVEQQGTKLEKYNQFVSSLADHVAVFQPVLSELLKLMFNSPV